MAAVAPDLAAGIRRGLVVGEATEPDRPDSPGLIILDAEGEVVSLSLGARRWIELLSHQQQGRGSLPASIASAAAAAFACARGEHPNPGSTVNVRSVDGCWVSVHGTLIGLGHDAKAAVIIEPAHPDRMSPLLMAIYGLTPREQQVTRLVLQGRSTPVLAARLKISPLTVQ